MTVTRKLQGGYVWLLMVVLALAGVSVGLTVWLNSWRADYSTSVSDTNRANEVLVKITDTAAYGLAASSLDVSAQDTLSGIKQATDANFQTITKDLDVLAQNATTSETSLISNMQNLTNQYDQGFQKVLSLAATDASQAHAALDSIRSINTQLQGDATTFAKGDIDEQAGMLARLNNLSRTIMIVAIILAAFAVLTGVFIAAFLSRTISQQLRNAFKMISTSASELLAVATQVAASAAQTAASSNETTATVEEVKQTALLAHEKATEVATNSQNLAQVAQTGRAVVEDTVAAFERTQTQMDLVAETINRLGEQTQAVADIITTVSDLAEQSNLLSVNASIEAAKAGEYGKGFTVVAQEVKSLAEQSKQAAGQVRTILNEIQKASDLAVKAAEQGRQTVEAGRQQSAESGDAISSLADYAGESAKSAVQISASSRQQLAGMDQISQAIASITEAGTQSAAGTRQVEQEVSRLQELALNLRRLIDARATA